MCGMCCSTSGLRGQPLQPRQHLTWTRLDWQKPLPHKLQPLCHTAAHLRLQGVGTAARQLQHHACSALQRPAMACMDLLGTCCRQGHLPFPACCQAHRSHGMRAARLPYDCAQVLAHPAARPAPRARGKMKTTPMTAHTEPKHHAHRCVLRSQPRIGNKTPCMLRHHAISGASTVLISGHAYSVPVRTCTGTNN